MKKVIFLLPILFLSLSVFSQSNDMAFAEMSHDFGSIKEESGKVSHVFSFTNKGGSPIILTDVTTSCGCTAREYTREPIAPGGQGTVTVTYNPAGRPGPFLKTVTVKANNERKVLTIKGNVVPKSKTTK
ncbi:MAG: DUF1573 domain-containing protein [Paludibacteraceae bacterium]|nr:DUF1573 domain-containing protein [Paludibacteraceae bacterium]